MNVTIRGQYIFCCYALPMSHSIRIIKSITCDDEVIFRVRDNVITIYREDMNRFVPLLVKLDFITFGA